MNLAFKYTIFLKSLMHALFLVYIVVSCYYVEDQRWIYFLKAMAMVVYNSESESKDPCVEAKQKL